MMRGLIALLPAFILIGCLSTNPPAPQHDKVHVTIELVDEIDNDPSIYGTADCDGPYCYIWIRRDQYPNCITHEVMHAFSGPWHGDHRSIEFCEVY